jgi:flavin reductase (DIM6/NTAB) family NADH-FMN oxidoreductase RutF
MLTIDPKIEKTSTVHKYILGAVAPRPIAFASTIDNDENLNLSPFSFFNAFSANPPILVFSPARRVRGNTIKHTLENVLENKEVVISIVTAEMAHQVSLSSSDFPKEINEFEKAGFTPVKSEKVKPFCVKESPVNFECKVNQVISLGEEGGAGNLVICEILKIHINEDILDSEKNIDPLKLNALSRLGGNWYGKATKDSLFQLAKPIGIIGMGIDKLPENIRNSEILTGNELAILASAENIPAKKEFTLREEKNTTEKHILAKELLSQGKSEDAWQILL